MDSSGVEKVEKAEIMKKKEVKRSCCNIYFSSLTFDFFFDP